MSTETKPTGAGEKASRTRNWVFIGYPEPLPDNWRDILDELHTPYVISPLHDRDVNADGTPKKPHYHIVLAFSGVKSYEQVKAVTDKLNCPKPERVANMTGQLRYLIHRDNPEKAQYRAEDIIDNSMGVVDVARALLSKSEELELSKDIFAFCYNNNIIEFTELINYCIAEAPEWYTYLIGGHSWIFIEYIKSLRHGGCNYGKCGQACDCSSRTGDEPSEAVREDTGDVRDNEEHTHDCEADEREHSSSSEGAS